MHKDFRFRSALVDIALLKVERDIKFNDDVMPACLPKSENISYVGKNVIVSGKELQVKS